MSQKEPISHVDDTNVVELLFRKLLTSRGSWLSLRVNTKQIPSMESSSEINAVIDRRVINHPSLNGRFFLIVPVRLFLNLSSLTLAYHRSMSCNVIQ